MADFVIRLRTTDPKEILKLTTALKNPERILRQIGMVLVGEAQKAFREQRLGAEAWPPRYPGQRGAPVNIAGLIADFRAGKSRPPARRFQDRPAGIDTGQTLRSLAPSQSLVTSGLTVQVQSNTIGAKMTQSGGTSVQLVTKQVKERLAEWMKRSRRRAKREKGRAQPPRAEDAAAMSLGWLFSKKSLRTKVTARPFLGVTPEAEAKIIRITGGEFVKETRK